VPEEVEEEEEEEGKKGGRSAIRVRISGATEKRPRTRVGVGVGVGRRKGVRGRTGEDGGGDKIDARGAVMQHTIARGQRTAGVQQLTCARLTPASQVVPVPRRRAALVEPSQQA
jgi:hypothetical protein